MKLMRRKRAEKTFCVNCKNEIDAGFPFCPLCGSPQMFQNGLNGQEVAMLYHMSKEDRRKGIKRLLIALIVIAILIGAGFGIYNVAGEIRASIKVSHGLIRVGSYTKYIGVDYKTVVKQLEKKGFTDINLYEKHDGLIFKNDNKVYDIAIDGVSNFDKYACFDEDDEVEIWYH